MNNSELKFIFLKTPQIKHGFISYDKNNNLIVTEKLKNKLLHIIFPKPNNRKINNSIINNIIDPLDNNKNMVLTPIETIKLFNKYQISNEQIKKQTNKQSDEQTNKQSDDKIYNIIESYIINLCNNI